MMFKKLFILSALFFAISNSGNCQIITTYAGDTTNGYSGDGGPATAAQLMKPCSVATDKIGNLFILDNEASCVRKVDTNGIITTFAGTGIAGYNGDSILATTAMLFTPLCIATDTDDNVYIADGAGRLRKVDTNGIITTIYSGAPSGVFAETISVNREGHVYFASGYSIYSLNAGTATQIISPNFLSNALTFDTSGSLYIAAGNGTPGMLAKMDTFDAITYIAGDSDYNDVDCINNVPAFNCHLSLLRGVAISNSGVFFIAEDRTRILKINSADTLSVYAGICNYSAHSGDGGDPLSAMIDLGNLFASYNSIAIDRKGNLYIVEPDYHDVRKIAPAVSTTSVKHVSNRNDVLSIYPNPSDGNYTLSLSSSIEGSVRIIITNMLGEQLKEFETSTNTELHIHSDLPLGNYFISSTSTSGKSTKLFTIK